MINNNLTIVEVHGNFTNKEFWEEFKERVILSSTNLNIKFFDINDKNIELTNSKVLEELSRVIELEKTVIYSPGCKNIEETSNFTQCLEDTPQAIVKAWCELISKLSQDDDSFTDLSRKLNSLDKSTCDIEEILNKLI